MRTVDKSWWEASMYIDRLCPVCTTNVVFDSDDCPHSVADIERSMAADDYSAQIDPSCASLSLSHNQTQHTHQ